VSNDFSVNVLAGIVSWLAFQDLLGRASGIFLGHANLVKQIVFPVGVLPLKTTLATVIPHAGALVFAVGYAGWHGTLSILSLALPFIVLFQLLAMIGIAFLLASVGVFFKDLRDIVSVLCTINLFAQPILYNPYATPEWLDWVFHFNPFSYLIWCWQDALFYGYIAHPVAWVALPIGSLATLVLGWKVFQSTKQAFGDAL